MMRMHKRLWLGVTLATTLMTGAAHAGMDGNVLFDIAARKEALATQAYAPARQACLVSGGEKMLENVPTPMDELKETEGYGSDNRAEGFSWYVMVQGGRALAGDEKAAASLRDMLLAWAKAGALLKTKESHDTYYALKRIMLPVVVNYAIIAPSLSDDDRATIEAWIDPLVRRLNTKFGGDVDVNNHRYLADSVLMAWGAYKGDNALMQQGIDRYHEALRAARPDGSLPLETRRGARATWYMRHALGSLTVMAEIAALHGSDLYSVAENKVTLDTILGYFIDATNNRLFILPRAAQNYIPGPSEDYIHQDLGFLSARPNQRHYMAFAEAYLAHEQTSLNAKRFAALMQRTGFKERPLIDDYLGGNATCFFWKPTVQQGGKQ